MTLLALKALVAILSLHGAGIQAQKTETLAAYLPKLKWDAAKSGPLLVVDPDHVAATSESSGLSAFGRKLFTVGTISAIAPTEMVLIDENFKDPNLYDGLPMNAKVLYLLSLLSPEQASLATTTGISKSDLKGEQIAVFASLMPRPFGWTIRTVGQGGGQDAMADGGIVPDDRLDSVKLKISSALSFNVYVQSPPGSFATFDASMVAPEPGDILYERDRSLDDAHKTPLTVDPRVSVPNKPKPSQLNYGDAGLDKIVIFPAPLTIATLLHAVGEATGLEIHADVRVSNLAVVSAGTQARSGDLLQAVALCVGGTYRRVGTAYELTSDIHGMGQTDLKFAARASLIGTELQARESAWRQAAAQSGAFARIKFDTQDPLAPNRNGQNDLDQMDDNWTADKVPITTLGPAVQAFLTWLFKQHANSHYDTDQVGLHSEAQFAFVTPDGRTLQPEPGGLGKHFQFTSVRHPAPQDAEKVEPFKLAPDSANSLVVRAETASEALKAIDLARAHGFKNVWLVTHQSEALTSALQFGINLSLVIRPWESVGTVSSESIDRNILGQTGSEIGAATAQEAEWQRFVDFVTSKNFSPAAFYNSCSPLDPSSTARWANLANLFHAPKLAGVILLDTEPQGYEPTISSNGFGNYPQWIAGLTSLGYSDDIRLAFLREHGMDPIDITPPQLRLKAELDREFFPESVVSWSVPGAGGPMMRQIQEHLQESRAKLNEQGLRPLLALMRDLAIPIKVAPRSVSYPSPPAFGRYVVPWEIGGRLPTVDLMDSGPSSSHMSLFTFVPGLSPRALRNLGKMLSDPGSAVAVDASSIKLDELQKLLDKYFPKVGD